MSSALSMRIDRYGGVRKKSNDSVAATAATAPARAPADDRRDHDDEHEDQREVRVVDLGRGTGRARSATAIAPSPPSAMPISRFPVVRSPLAIAVTLAQSAVIMFGLSAHVACRPAPGRVVCVLRDRAVARSR